MARTAPPSSITLTIGGLPFPALAAGPEDGELVLCLHGFPQSAKAFTGVLPVVAAAGFRAVALTQRGYTAGNRTDRVADYAVQALADDAVAAAEALGARRFHLVGHDLGAIIGWHLAATQPERLRSLTAVSVPHPAAFAESLLRSSQPLRSAYAAFFKLPVVPEVSLGAFGGRPLELLLRRSGLSAADARSYVRDLLPARGLRVAFHYYRNLRASQMARTPAVGVPTTFVWSDGDVALGRVGAERTARHVTGDYRFEVLEGASHWIPEQHPDVLGDLVVDRARAST
jgi:pimeloyl-ACP methyl ester carboxylesterase